MHVLELAAEESTARTGAARKHKKCLCGAAAAKKLLQEGT